MKKRMDFPKVWKDCPDIVGEDHWEISCPKCVKNNKLRKSLFSSGSKDLHEGLESTGLRMSYLSKIRATIAYIIACILTVIVVFSVLNPAEKHIQGAVYIIGLPVLIISGFILRQILRIGVGVWKYKCNNCGQELTIVSNGKMAAYGTIEEKKLGKKIEGGEKIDEKALDSLIEDLKNEDSKVRERAASVLADIEDSRKIEPLIEAFKDKDERVRKKIANTLVKTGNRRAIESLVNQSQTDESNSVKAHINFVITEQIRGIKAVKYITRGMMSKDERIRDLAYEAFFKRGDKQALETLIQAMKDSKIE